MADKKDKGLEASMWAQPWARSYQNKRHFDPRSRSVPPPPTNPTASTGPAPSTSSSMPPAQAFHRFEQACHRLRWKFIDLQSSYRRAMNPEEAGFATVDAERNFKVDFHEFYMWIEQALVLVLAVFGVAVPRGQGHLNGGGATSASHAYHHNVLRALEDEDNPLHGVMGSGEVNQALWKAKELRNRWKDAAEGRETPPLKMYDLTWIVGQILGGLEVAYGMAQGRVAEETARAAAEGMAQEKQPEQEDGWDWMVEPMDWET